MREIHRELDHYIHLNKPLATPAHCAVNGDVIWCDRRITLGWGPLWMKRRSTETTASNKHNSLSESYTICYQTGRCFHSLDWTDA